MVSPKKRLKTYERVDIPASNSGIYQFLRKTTWSIVVIIVLGSFFFQSNLFNELSWTSRMIFIALVLGISFLGPKKSATLSELEIWFYDDYFIVYRNKRYYNPKVSYREYNKFFYSDVSSMDYDYRTRRFNIRGKIDATFFKYDKNGIVSDTPHYQKITDGGICYFYVINNDEDNLISNMEEHLGQEVMYRHKKEEH